MEYKTEDEPRKEYKDEFPKTITIFNEEQRQEFKRMWDWHKDSQLINRMIK